MKKFTFSIDRGGTFTDILCEVKDSRTGSVDVQVMKLLSVDPHYTDAPTEAIRRFIEKNTNNRVKTSMDIDTKMIEWIRMGTTVATNALLERKGKDVVLITTKGFQDLLEIGNQARPDIFSLVVKKSPLLYKKVIELEERVIIKKYDGQEGENEVVKGTTGTDLIIEKKPDLDMLRKQLIEVKEMGIESIAVVLLHSYMFHDHELLVEKLAKEIGFKQVSLSHEIIPMIRIVPRGYTTLVDAYLSPILREYLDSFCSGFKNNLEEVDVKFMQSDGGLTDAKTFYGSKSIFSGPAGGVVGYSETAYSGTPLIGFDMGGTSTDVSRYTGQFEHQYDTEIAGVRIQTPQLDISTVASGGGSRLFFKQGRFIVGPESASSHPGPVCYGKNGYLAITDANLILGRIIPEFFPKIFGKNEDEPLNYEKTKKAFEDLTEKVNEHRKKMGDYRKMTIEEVALGFVSVANESMCRPIRSITASKGYDTRKHELVAFGGAAPQHSCSVAKILGISKVKIHKYTGILSAVGLSLANTVEEFQEPCNMEYKKENLDKFEQKFTEMEKKAREKLKNFARVDVIKYLNLRYDGTDFSIMTNIPENSSLSFKDVFERKYQREYGFILPGRNIIVDDIRVRGIGKVTNGTKGVKKHKTGKTDEVPVKKMHKIYIDGKWMNVAVYDLEELHEGMEKPGPCIIQMDTSTVLVENNCIWKIDDNGNIEIDIRYDEMDDVKKIDVEKCDPIMLSIFSHRFMSIAEEMGKTLQRTSISTNIKERLDFSCAIFGPDGRLVANGCNIPVHLGSMADAVKYQIEYYKKEGMEWKNNDVVMTNHPVAGGTHLPDITVITPVYLEDEAKGPAFYVASRGHHADIGGLTAGSFPPFSKNIRDEGIAVVSFKIVENGEFQDEKLREIMKSSRAIKDNVADLKAQIASNNKGQKLFKSLIKEYSLKVVHSYMNFIQSNAEEAVRSMLLRFSEKLGKEKLKATDFMDDGSKIELVVGIDKVNRSAVFDFSGTSEQVYGNWNAPKAVSTSAVLYTLRVLVGDEIPLNDGCLKAVEIIVPKNSLLDPGKDCAVVGGNVETSQRITDVIFKAFDVVSASQGTMNNFCFGSDSFGYYETICGGTGASEKQNGASGVHSHMTNTRITDTEILESRYPIIVRKFSIRKNSGGKGKRNGGDGVVRSFEFLDDLQVSILSERRVFSPYGVKGGEPGKKGKNLLIKKSDGKDGEKIVFNLGGKNAVNVKKHDIIVIKTPGAGGFGKKEEEE